MMKIVITGGKGQLGLDCREVLAADHQVSAFGSAELDITNTDAVRKVYETLSRMR